jgi:Kef-type K+ transport system membrane component KefB
MDRAELLVPFFLAGVGLHLDVRVFSQFFMLALSLVIFAAAVVSKLSGCGLGAYRLGGTEAWRVGCGMNPRGEVGLVVAHLGQNMGVISQAVDGVVVFMAVATTLVAPANVGGLFPRRNSENGRSRRGLPA